MEHPTAIRGLDRGRRGRRQVEAEMDLLVDVAAAIHIGALVREAGFDGAVHELLESALPQDLGGRLVGEGGDRLVVDAAQIAIDPEIGGE